MRLFVGIAAVAASALALPACSSDPASPSELQAVAGTYTLRTISDANLPVASTDRAGDTLEILGSTLILSPNGTCTERLRTRLTTRGTVSATDDTFSCRYAVSGTTVTLTYSSGGVVTGSYNDGTLATTPDSRLWRYQP